MRGSIALLLLVTLTLGCEQNVDPIAGSDFPYTIWGFMNAGADTQVVRVFPIRDELIPERGSEIDARVFSTDLNTGERREWVYERVQFDSLIEGHLFKAPFRAEHLHRYRLEVVRSDGEMSSSEVEVPSEVEFNIDIDEQSVVIPVEIRGDIPNLIGLRVTYHAVNIPPASAWPPGTPVPGAVQLPVIISYDHLVRQIDGGWRLEINMTRDFEAVRSAYQNNCLVTDIDGSAPFIVLRRMDFSALLADGSWDPPGGIFDPNVLSVPGTFSNVENGYGFFGAGQGILHDWSPNLQVAELAGYRAEQRCLGFAQDIPECYDPPMPCLQDNIDDIWEEWLE